MSNDSIQIQNEDAPSKFIIQQDTDDEGEKKNIEEASQASSLELQPSNNNVRRHHHQQQQQQQEDEDDDEDFDMYMNPAKKRKTPLQPPPRRRYEEEDDEDDYETESEYSRKSRRSTHSRSSKYSTVQQKVTQEKIFKQKELLRELEELKARGYETYGRYSLESRFKDVEHEVKLGKRYFEQKSLQTLFEHGFFSLVYAIERAPEFLPEYCNPLGVNLSGLYDSTLMSKDQVSHELRLIVKKWIGDEDGVLPPEIKLGLILCGCIFTTAISNQFGKMLTKNPAAFGDLIGGMMNKLGAAGGSSGGGGTPGTSPDLSSLFSAAPPAATQAQAQPPAAPPQQPSSPHQWGPPPMPVSTRPQHYAVDNSDRFSVHSVDSESDYTSKRRSRPRRKNNRDKKRNSIDIF